jgi:hypothetical protein
MDHFRDFRLIGDSYLLHCKENYFDKVTPSNKLSPNKEGYKKIVEIAKKYFEKGAYLDFASFFRESQYFIALWTAHMIVEYGSPSNELRMEAINVIKKYSENPLAPKVAEEEQDWIKGHGYTKQNGA